MPRRRIIAACLTLAVLAPALRAVERDYPPWKRGQVTVQVQVEAQPPRGEQAADPMEIRLSGALVITFTVDGPSSLEVQLDKGLMSVANWKKRGVSSWTPTEEGVRGQHIVILSPDTHGETTLPLALRFRESSTADHWEEAAWPPIKVQVTKPTSDALRDDLAPEEVPAPASWYRSWHGWVLGVGLTLFALALLVGAWLLRRRRARWALAVSPHEWACHELQRIEALGLSANGQMKRFYTLLSGVIRQYLEKRFGLHAPRQTTPEFLETVRQAPLLSPSQQDLLRAFLERCDLVKFAQAVPSPEECQATVLLARAFVEQTAPPPEPVKDGV